MENIEPIIQKIVEKLKARPEVLAVYLFGSHAKGYEYIGSDLDIGVMLDRSEIKGGENFYSLQDDLNSVVSDEIDVIDVDLVILQNAPITLQHSIICGRLLFSRDGLKRGEEESIIQNNYDDLKDYTDLRLQYNILRAKRNLKLL